ILGIAGLPAVLYAGADYASRAYAAAHPVPPDVDAVATSGAGAVVTLFAELVKLFALSVAATGITRLVLGLPSGKPVYFPLDWTALRMFGANLRFVLGAGILVALALLVVLVVYRFAGVPTDATADVQPTPAMFVAALISWAIFVSAFLAIVQMG